MEIDSITNMPFRLLRQLPEQTQVLLRLRKMAGTPGHRVFLHELADRLEKLVAGKLAVEELFKDGWCMGRPEGSSR